MSYRQRDKESSRQTDAQTRKKTKALRNDEKGEKKFDKWKTRTNCP